MTPKLKWLMAGGVVAALAGTAAFAGTLHHMTVNLPQGGTATVEYSGDVVPRVTFSPLPLLQDSADLRVWSPFTEMERVSAMMDAMAADMDGRLAASLQQVRRLTPGMTEAGLTALPPGTESYSVTTISTGQGVCTREVRMTRGGEGMKPQMISRSSGCGDEAGPPAGVPKATAIKASPRDAAVPRQRI